MPISPADVAALAALARLRLEPGAAERLAGELEGILAHVETLAAVAADNAIGSAPDNATAAGGAGAAAGEAGATAGDAWQALPTRQALRPDVSGADPLHVAPEAMAPEWRDGFFTVPRLTAQRGDPDHE